MLVVRYFMWIMLFHLVTFYKTRPDHFIFGVVSWFYYFALALIAEPESRTTVVHLGAQGLLEGLDAGSVPSPPRFIRRRLMRFYYEGE